MAYTNFTPETHIQQSQDAKSFRIWDESVWNGQSGNTIKCDVIVHFINDKNEIIVYDPYPLIVGAVRTKFDSYLSRDGHIVELADLTIDGDAPAERFEDGYYIIKTIFDDGTYGVGLEPYFNNNQAFLAKNRCMKRKMASRHITWPLTDNTYRKSRDIFLQGLYLECAENAVDLGKKDQFVSIMALVKAMFDHYEIESCW